MKKRNLFKKIASVTLAATMFLSLMTMNVNADNIVLLDPAEGDICTTNTTYITEVKDSNNIVTGRVIDASGITAQTALAKAEDTTFTYRNIVYNDGVPTIGGASTRFKNNFTWEFDFCLNEVPATAGDNGCFYMQFGSEWKNAIKFFSVISGDTKRYYIRWGGGTNDASVYGISYKTDPWWIGSAYMLQPEKTYHLKFEVDARNNKVYATFTNPYITFNEEGKEVLSDTPAPEGTAVYTKTTSSMVDLGFVQNTLELIKTSWRRVPVVISAKSPVKLTLSNEKFCIDKFVNITPTITASEGMVTASTNSINITDFGFYGKLPTLLCAVYTSDGKLVASNMNAPTASPAAALTDNIYTADVDVSSLENGEYKVKAFVWNTVGKMQPYDNCLVENTLTVTDGVAAITE